jgi:hypothetical protein
VRPWFERRFSFDHLGADDLPFLLERLRGAPARVEERTRALDRDLLSRRVGERWSILEHVGHLADLDELHEARLEDYRAGRGVLCAADVTNRRTHEARHHERDPQEVAAAFRRGRERFVAAAAACGTSLALASALHPRLQQPMRLVDMLYFAAEHDDHHLAKVSELARR